MRHSVSNPITDGTAWVLKHAAGAAVVAWDDSRMYVDEMDVLTDFLRDPGGPYVQPGIAGPAAMRMQERAQAWADDYNAGGGRKERALRSIGR